MANNVGEWSATAASNTSLGAVSLQENIMLVNAVNNAFRELMAQVASGISTNAFMGAYTPASASAAASLQFPEDTDNGANKVTVTAPAALSGDVTITWPAETGTLGVIIDEDSFATDSATKVPSQQSAKAYIDAAVAGIDLLTLGADTATTSGSSVSFTGIPATAKRITLSWRDGSINGTGTISVQIGDSGGLETTGYVGQRWQGSAGANPDTAAWSTGALWDTVVATEVVQMTATLTLVNSASNIWQIAITGSSETRYSIANGYKALSAALDRIALVTNQAFDAGSINIAYE